MPALLLAVKVNTEQLAHLGLTTTEIEKSITSNYSELARSSKSEDGHVYLVAPLTPQAVETAEQQGAPVQDFVIGSLGSVVSTYVQVESYRLWNADGAPIADGNYVSEEEAAQVSQPDNSNVDDTVERDGASDIGRFL